jgi:hypothetical protein
MVMQKVIYNFLVAMPSKLVGTALSMGGIAATAWPIPFRKWAEGVMNPEQIRFYGIAAILISVIYWAIVLWVKPKDVLENTKPHHWGVLAREILAAVAKLPYHQPTNPDGSDHIGLALQGISAAFNPRLATAFSEIRASRIDVPESFSRSPINQHCWEERAHFLLDAEQKL